MPLRGRSVVTHLQRETVGFMSKLEAVSRHYDRLDPFYRSIWGEHIHHGLWTDPEDLPEEAVRHLVHCVAEDARIEAGTRVCDIGCGYGAPARMWAETYGANVTGFTISEHQHAHAQRQSVDGPRPDLRLQDLFENGIAGDTFDAVVAIESLTHFERPRKVLREAARLLRPGGRLVVCAWMAAQGSSPWAQRHLLDPICREGRLSELPTASALHRWTTDAGLKVRHLDDVTHQVRWTWSVILRRFVKALFTDPSVLRMLLDATEPDRIFARTILRIWLAQHLGVLRYGWLVAEAGGTEGSSDG